MGPKGASSDSSRIRNLAVQSSSLGVVIPVGWGTNRVKCNLLWYAQFKAQSHTSKQGGKGGPAKSTTYTYTASVIMGIANGPIVGVRSVYRDKDTFTGSGALASAGLGLASGTIGQAPWGYLTTNFPSQAIGYSGIAYVYASNYSLTDSATIQNHSFEVTFGLAVSGLLDANPKDIVTDFLTNAGYGVPGWASGLLGDFTSYSGYCLAANLLLSPVLESQVKASEALTTIIEKSSNSTPFWSEGVLKIVPRGDATVTGNGVTWVPNLTPVYDLTEDDFMPMDSRGTPVLQEIADQSDAYNYVQIEYLDRSNQYNPSIQPADDLANIDQYKLRKEDPVALHAICDAQVAKNVAQLRLQRTLNVRDRYKFKLPDRFILIEQADYLTLTTTTDRLLLNRILVRVLEIDEDPEGHLTFLVEGLPDQIASAAVYPSHSANGYIEDTTSPPGNVVAPTIVNAPTSLTGGEPQIWIAAASSIANWGGCEVWQSVDNAEYSYSGRIGQPARYGTLTTALPLVADPDTTSVCGVDLSYSLGTLLSASAADRDAGTTLCLIGSEIISYRLATLTAGSAYNLSDLRRGLYGTTIAAHSIGEVFTRIDANIYKLQYPKRGVGATVYFKFLSFNIWGLALQSLSSVNTYSLTAAPSLITGLGIDYANLSGVGKPADGATRNVVTYSVTAPASSMDGDLWVDLSGTFAVFKLRSSGAWVIGANALATYNALSGRPIALADISTTESSKLAGIAAGADVTLANTAAGIINQGGLATKNTVASGDLSVVVGGGNLLKNSSFDIGSALYVGWSAYNTAAATEPTTYALLAGGRTGGQYVELYCAGNSTNGKGFYLSGINANVFRAGVKYVWSFYARAPSGSNANGVTMALGWNNAPTTQVAVSNPGLTTSWQRYVFTLYWAPTATADPSVFVYLNITGFSGLRCDFDDIQLEEGDVATAYSPLAPGDASSLYYPNGYTVDGLRPAELGANVTLTHTSAGIQGQGAWATSNISYSTTAPSGPLVGDIWVNTTNVPNVWQRYTGTAWVAATPTNTTQLTDGANLGNTAAWTGVSARPANLSGLTGTEAILNTGITMSSAGVLSGAGGGTVTLLGVGFSGDPDAQRNNRISINPNGTLTGAGTGSVTIGGLGYTGALNADVTNYGDTRIANSGITVNANGTLTGAGTGAVTLAGVGFSGDPDAQRNSRITMSSAGALVGAGGGSITALAADNLIDGATYGRYALAERTKLGTVATNATSNNITYSATAPTSPGSGDLWVDTSVTPTVTRVRSGAAWVAASTNVTNTNQVTDGANLGGTAAWGSVSARPSNLSGLVGTEGILNTGVTISSAGVLSGAGGGSITSLSSDNLADGVTYGRYALTERTKLGTVAANADVTLTHTAAGITGQGAWATSAVTYAATAPVSPLTGDVWINTTAVPNVWQRYSGAAWVATTPTNTTQLTDGANLGGTAAWTGVASRPSNLSSLVGTEPILNTGITISSVGVLSGAGGGSITALSSDNLADGVTYGRYQIAERTKLGTVATNATVGARVGTNLLDASGVSIATDAAIKNSAVTITAAGVLSGAGGGSITALAADNLIDGATYGRYALTERTKLGTVATNADVTLTHTAAGITGQGAWATSVVTYATTAPVSPLTGDIWINTTSTPNVWQRYTGAAWVATTPTNTNQLADGANLGGTSAWTGVTSRPANLSSLAGSEPILNTGITISSVGVLSGAGGGSITALSSDNLADGATYGRYALTERTKLGTVAANATSNNVTYSATAPVTPGSGDIWVDTSVTPNVTRVRSGAAWVAASNYVTNTNQVTDGANLGGTAAWGSVSSRPSNLSSLAGTEAILNTGVTITAAGVLTGAGGGSITSLSSDNLADGATYGRYALTERTKLGTVAANADVTLTHTAAGITGQGAWATSVVSYATTAPVSPVTGDVWINTTAVPNVWQRYSGTAWVATTPTNTTQLSDGANLGGTAAWGSVSSRPANISSLVGTEPILNTGITMSSAGVLSGAGGGSITSLSSDNLADGSTYGRYALTERTKLGTVAANATSNNISYSATAPVTPGSGDLWVDTSVTPNVSRVRSGAAWVAASNYVTNTNQVTDGANLGGTAAWGSVSSRPANISSLVGSEPILNTGITISSAGVLSGAGGGSITALGADNLVDGATYGRYALTERTKLGTVAANADVTLTHTAAGITGQGSWATSVVTYATTAPVSPVTGDIWINTTAVPNIWQRYSGAAWVATTPTNTTQLTDGANLGGTAAWGSVSSRPANISGLVGTEAILNTGITITSAGVLSGAGGGSITALSSDNLADGATYGRYALTERTKLGTVATNADVTLTHTAAGITGQGAWATSAVTYATTAPTSPVTGDVWINTTAVPNVWQRYTGSAWVATTPTNTSQLTDGANLGGTAAWTGVASRPANLSSLAGTEPILNTGITLSAAGALSGAGGGSVTIGGLGYTGSLTATSNNITYSATAPTTPGSGDIWVDTSVTPNVSRVRSGAAWVAASNYVTNTNQVTDGANLGGTAAWGSVTSRPSNLSSLAGTEAILNTGITISSAGILSGAGGGSITALSSDNLADGATYGRYALAERTKLGTVATNATSNNVTYSATAPVTPGAGDFWVDTSVTPNVTRVRSGAAWVAASTNVTNTNQVTDGANLGGTSAWTGVSSRPANLSSLAGSEAILNTGITISSAGVLSGAGGGSITALAADNLIDGATYGRYALTERTKLGTVATNADVTLTHTAAGITGQGAWATSAVSYATTAPTSPLTGDIWINTTSTPNIWQRYNGTAWVATTPTNTTQLTDGANLGGTSAWTGVSARPSNLSSLVGTEAILNTGITINAAGTISGAGGGTVTLTGLGAGPLAASALTAAQVTNTGITMSSAGVLAGAGGGSITALAADNLIDGVTYGRYALTERTKLGTVAANADVPNYSDTRVSNAAVTLSSAGVLTGAGGGTVTIGGLGYTGSLTATTNNVSYSATAPATPGSGDIWVDTSVTPNVTRVRSGAAWVAASNYVTNTNQVTDGANLGGTSAWTGVSARPANLSSLAGTEAILNTGITINAAGTISGAGGGTVTLTGLGAGPLAASALTAAQVTNTGITISAAGVLSGAGGGSITALAADNLIDGATYGRYALAERTKLGGVAAGADVTSANISAGSNALGGVAAATVNANITSAAATAVWGSVSSRPANISSLAGTEPILNTGITISSAGVLSGAGGGSITALSSDNLADGATYGRYALAERTKLGGVAAGADVTSANISAGSNALGGVAAATVNANISSAATTAIWTGVSGAPKSQGNLLPDPITLSGLWFSDGNASLQVNATGGRLADRYRVFMTANTYFGWVLLTETKRISVYPGQIIYYQHAVFTQGTVGSTRGAYNTHDATGAYIGTYEFTGSSTTASASNGIWLTVKGTAVIPAGVSYIWPHAQGIGLTSGAYFGEPYVGYQAAGADVTLVNTAAGIVGQGSLAIKNTVTSSDLSVAMGGNNLLSNSSFDRGSSGFDNWGVYNNTPTTEPATLTSVSPGRTGGKAIRVDWGVSNTTSKGVNAINANSNLFKAGITYTVSFYAAATGTAAANAMSLAFNNNPSALVTVQNPTLTSAYQRYIFKILWNVGATVDPNIFFTVAYGAGGYGSLYLDDFQIEEGDVATGYKLSIAEAQADAAIAATTSTWAGVSSVPARLGAHPYFGAAYLDSMVIAYPGPAGNVVGALKPQEAGANVTESRVASAVSGQGALATLGSVNLNTQVNSYLDASRLIKQNVGWMDAYWPATTGADRTGGATAASISGQGPLATSTLTAALVLDNSTGWLNLGNSPMTIIGTSVIEAAGGVASNWDAAAYTSSKAYVGSISLEGRPQGQSQMLCITTNPTQTYTAGQSYINDYGYSMYAIDTGTVSIYRGGGQIYNSGYTWNQGNGWIFRITYDGVTVRFWVGSALIYSVATTISGSIYGRVSGSNPGSGFDTLKIGAYTQNDFTSIGGTNKPADNSTSDVKLAASTGVAITGNTLTCNGNASTWNSQAISIEAFIGGAFASAVHAAGNSVMFGLGSKPGSVSLTTGLSFVNIDYAIHASTNGSLYAYENGTGTGIGTNLGIGQTLSVEYNGAFVTYTQNGVVLRTIAAPVNLRLSFEASFAYAGDVISNVRFGPMSNSNWTAGQAFAGGVQQASNINPISSVSDSTSATITIYAHTLNFGGWKTVSYAGGTISGLALSTRYGVYTDDPNFLGTSSYVVTTDPQVLAASTGRHFVGYVTTGAAYGVGATRPDAFPPP